MYVCVCKGITETSLRQAISQGIDTHEQLAERLQVGQECGQCHRDVNALLCGDCTSAQCQSRH